jgi:hypothetical protein
MVMVCHKIESTGNSVSRKSLIGEKRKQKNIKVFTNECKCYIKLWQQQFRVWNILIMSIINMSLFGDKVDASYGGSLL